ncbi:MAG: CarD family transcriptional regulator [Candidatus Dojkabacteria bacterium]|jgi:CarD family transcriptional regulator|nr:CarD family transcriptional regulator [Candidatus Dojkabacteria bacterium]
MFKKNEKVIYPRFGAGKIIKRFKLAVGGEEREYLKVEFFNSAITVSVPVEKADELGLRKPLTKKGLLTKLANLGSKVNITDRTLKELDEVSRRRLLSGGIEDTIKLVNTLKSLAKKKREENKNFSYTVSEQMEIAVEFLKSEIELVLGKKAVRQYDL